MFTFGACDKTEETPNPFEGADNHITSFVLKKDDVHYPAAVSAGTITVTVPANVSLAGFTAEYQLCENAKIAPPPAGITDWDSEQLFIVTAYNGTKTTYKYTVEHSDVVRTGAVILTTQAEVDAFGQGSYTMVDGAIIIGRTSGTDIITSFAPLANLKTVSSIVINATYEGDLTAFEQLETLGELHVLSKAVKTVRFPKLKTVRLNMDFDQFLNTTSAVPRNIIDTLDFPELTIIERSLRIYYADSLASMNFPKLQRVLEDLMLQGAPTGAANNFLKLQSINFPELTAVGGTITLKLLTGPKDFTATKLGTISGFDVSSCQSLTNIDLSALTTVKGNLALNFNLQLPALTTVEGTLSLNLPTLTSLEGLSSLRKVGTFDAVDLRGITRIDVRGIEIGTLNFGSNTLLHTAGITLTGNETFPGKLSFNVPASGNKPATIPVTVEGIKEVGALDIPVANDRQGISAVSAIDFSWLERVTGLLNIGHLNNLTTLNLSNLQSVGGLKLDKLTVLETLNLSSLETITENGFNFELWSYDFTALELPALTSVVGNISITGLDDGAIVETISFPELTSLTGTLTIATFEDYTNDVFTDLSGFSKLTSAGGVTISNFTQLSNFSPLSKVVCSLTSAAKWNITGCGGTPADYSYETMVSTHCGN
jgi:hypothetical protein